MNIQWSENPAGLIPTINEGFADFGSAKYIGSKEYLGYTIASVHNLAFYLWLVKQAREHIIAGDFSGWKNDMVVKLQQKL